MAFAAVAAIADRRFGTVHGDSFILEIQMFGTRSRWVPNCARLVEKLPTRSHIHASRTTTRCQKALKLSPEDYSRAGASRWRGTAYNTAAILPITTHTYLPGGQAPFTMRGALLLPPEATQPAPTGWRPPPQDHIGSSHALASCRAPQRCSSQCSAGWRFQPARSSGVGSQPTA